MIKVSIIMPLYNAAKYLEESLESVLKQTLSEFELICVNDASTDATMDILRQFSDRDGRIKILINEERSGAAYSRNKGMKEAGGKYLSFLDGDDIFEEEMLETAYHAMEEHELDVVIYEYQHVPSKDIYQKRKILHSREYKDRYCRIPFCIGGHNPDEVLKWPSSPCNKLYRRAFIESNNLEFQTLSCANDVYFVNMALMLAGKIMALDDDRIMIYARDHFEPTRISYNRDPMCTFLAMEKVQKELVERKAFLALFQHYYYKLFYSMTGALLQTKQIENMRAFYNFLQKEGISRLITLGGECYDRVDEFIKQKIELFETNSFESGWYTKEKVFEGYLYGNEQLIRKLFSDYEKKGISVGIWGMGEQGRILLNFCRRNNLKVDVVVDKGKEKQGTTIAGYPIGIPEENYDRMQAVVISGRFIYESVKKELYENGKAPEIIDINQLLKIY